MLMWANMNFSEAYMAESQGVKKKDEQFHYYIDKSRVSV